MASFLVSAGSEAVFALNAVSFLGILVVLGTWRSFRVLYGTLGALLTTYVTFLPCFLFIFLLAPYIELLAGNRRIRAALTGVTAAVVGVIANLAERVYVMYVGVVVEFGSVVEDDGLGCAEVGSQCHEPVPQ